MASSATSLKGKAVNKGMLMSALFSLCQHLVMEAVRSQSLEGETICAFLDDVHAVCRPDRVMPIFNLFQRELWIHSRIEVHLGKTQVWNRGGFEPPGCRLLTEVARRVDPAAVVWRGDHTLPVDEQGVKVLERPLGHREFVEAQLRVITAEHHSWTGFLTDLQCAWLSLLFCAASRPNFVLRVHHEEDVSDAVWILATLFPIWEAWVSGAPSEEDRQHSSPVGGRVGDDQQETPVCCGTSS